MSREVPAEPASFILSYDMQDLATPGVAVEVDAQTAEGWGAFEETALSEEAAAAANQDGELTRGE